MKKITKTFLNAKYDELYDQATELILEEDHCKIREIYTLSHLGSQTMVGSGCMRCNGYANNELMLCCEGFADEPSCRHWGKGGCRVKSLRCRLWYCNDVNDGKMASVTFEIYTPTAGHPDLKNKRYLGHTRVPVLGQKHLDLLRQMKEFYFDRYFREGKVKAVDFAYRTLNGLS